jgi:hypothetical protein
MIVLLGSLSDDLRGLGHHAEGDRSKHGAGSDEGEKLGHLSWSLNWVVEVIA